jgi:hypothetical protein
MSKVGLAGRENTSSSFFCAAVPPLPAVHVPQINGSIVGSLKSSAMRIGLVGFFGVVGAEVFLVIGTAAVWLVCVADRCLGRRGALA